MPTWHSSALSYPHCSTLDAVQKFWINTPCKLACSMLFVMGSGENHSRQSNLFHPIAQETSFEIFWVFLSWDVRLQNAAEQWNIMQVPLCRNGTSQIPHIQIDNQSRIWGTVQIMPGNAMVQILCVEKVGATVKLSESFHRVGSVGKGRKARKAQFLKSQHMFQHVPTFSKTCCDFATEELLEALGLHFVASNCYTRCQLSAMIC